MKVFHQRDVCQPYSGDDLKNVELVVLLISSDTNSN